MIAISEVVAEMKEIMRGVPGYKDGIANTAAAVNMSHLDKWIKTLEKHEEWVRTLRHWLDKANRP